jgi:membrane-associated protein
MHVLIDLFGNIDTFMLRGIELMGGWMYAAMFAVIFCETGLVVTPFLPGDSLLFAAGAFAHPHPGVIGLNIWVLAIVLCAAAIIGDSVNYAIGHFLGPRLLKNPNSKVFRKEYLDRTHAFFERYGGKTIVLARFVPIIRTFAPFLAGVGGMHYRRFIEFNVVGGVLWVMLFLLAGYFFGGIQVVKDNMTLVLIAVVLITTVPIAVEAWRTRRESKREAAAAAAAADAAPEAE